MLPHVYNTPSYLWPKPDIVHLKHPHASTHTATTQYREGSLIATHILWGSTWHDTAQQNMQDTTRHVNDSIIKAWPC